jgi:hypothetical protein
VANDEREDMRQELEHQRRWHQDAANFRDQLWSHAMEEQDMAGSARTAYSTALNELTSRLETCEAQLYQERQLTTELQERLRVHEAVSGDQINGDGAGPPEEEARKRRRLQACSAALARVMDNRSLKEEGVDPTSLRTPSPLSL